MNIERLKEYAHLIAKLGVNVQEGQDVIIRAYFDQPDFVVYVAEECYKLGARKVRVEWSHMPLERLDIDMQSQDTLSEVTDWEIEKFKHNVKTLPAMIYIISVDPDGLCGVDQKKYAAARAARTAIIKPYRDSMEDKYQWCIAAVPGVEWARKVFPGVSDGEAVEKLWEAILSCSRVNGNAIANWNEHNRALKERYTYLNSLGLSELHYTASNGTDLTVGLIEGARFMGGCEPTLGGIIYNPNIPSEEIFTSPMKGKAEGVVYSSMPFSYQGRLMENFGFRFENGKVVEVITDNDEDRKVLTDMINMDENSAYLGECALIPYDSPIRNSETIFYNTLFDENAACHLALGSGFNGCLEGFENMTFEQCVEKGINSAFIHEDFMIGTADMCIDGKTRDGRIVPIFRSGNWSLPF